MVSAPTRATYEQWTREAAERYGLPDLGFSVDMGIAQISQESGYADDVIYGRRVSSAGAQGIAQFMPDTAAAYNVNPLDPLSALDGWARHMRDLIRYFDGDIDKALAGYNAGAGGVDRAVTMARQAGGDWRRFIPDETKEYLSAITSRLSAPASPYQAVDNDGGGSNPPGPDWLFDFARWTNPFMRGGIEIPGGPRMSEAVSGPLGPLWAFLASITSRGFWPKIGLTFASIALVAVGMLLIILDQRGRVARSVIS